MVTAHSQAGGNSILAALPSTERKLVSLLVENVGLLPGEVVCAAGKTIQHVYFPRAGVLSLFATTDGGPNEVAIFDFSEPCRSPLPELARIEETLQAKGWLSDSEFEFTVEDGEATRAVTWNQAASEA